jgi:hypothetical protein
LPGVLEESVTLDQESWSTVLDQGEPLAFDTVRLTIEPTAAARFFRLKFDQPSP